MPLRLIEVTIPADSIEYAENILKEAKYDDLRILRASNNLGLVHILLDAQQTEAVSDLLVKHLGTKKSFRLISLPVEATLPPIERETQKSAEEKPKSDAFGTRRKRISREEIYDDLSQASELTSVFVATVALSTIVAAVGLLRSDVAIIIGAMVIAPLLGPNVALSLASTLGDLDLARRSLKAIGVGIATATMISVFLGVALHVDPNEPEIHARTQADAADVALALAAGAAGSLAFTSGVPAAVVGVMVAVALLPPLVVVGLLLGSGNIQLAMGALILVLTNVTCINLAAVATFWAQKVHPRTWWETKRARRATQIAATAWVILLAILFALIIFGQVEPV